MGLYGGYELDQKQVAIAVAEKSCLACKNFRASHKDTKLSYCADGSKTVFKDSGCDKFEVLESSKKIALSYLGLHE